MDLYRIIYASRASDLARDDIAGILAACERNNPRLHVTGMLLLDNGHFLQLLEGRRSAVSDRLFAISRDPRHHGVEVLTCGPIASRLFSDWSMHHVAVHGANAQTLRRYLGGAQFDPFVMSAPSVEQLCLDIAAHSAAAAFEQTLRRA